MKKPLLFFPFFSMFVFFAGAQVKVGNNPGTVNSKAIFEMEHTSKGMLLPRVADTNAITGGGTKGLFIYSLVDSVIYYHDGIKWRGVLNSLSSINYPVSVNCNTAGFNGVFAASIPLSGESYKVTITNNGLGAAVIAFANTDLVLSGPGLGSVIVGIPTPASPVTIPSGGSQTITYPLTGTPGSNVGDAITGVWTKLSLNCTKQVTLTDQPPTWNCSATTSTLNIQGGGTAFDLIFNTSYTGGATATYTSSNTSNYVPYTQTINGLTLTSPAGTYTPGTNQVSYTLSGTYTGADYGFVTFTLPGGCTVSYGCGGLMPVTHTAGVNGAPTTRSINYGTVLVNNQCWITQNLGASTQATSATDPNISPRGWFFRFNRSQGFQNEGSLIPVWPAYTNEPSGWDPLLDPCTNLLGAPWRLPTNSEWNSTDASMGWNNQTQMFNSVLKLHAAGFLNSANGSLSNNGGSLIYWSSTPYDLANGYYMVATTGAAFVSVQFKSIGSSIRCLR